MRIKSDEPFIYTDKFKEVAIGTTGRPFADSTGPNYSVGDLVCVAIKGEPLRVLPIKQWERIADFARYGVTYDRHLRFVYEHEIAGRLQSSPHVMRTDITDLKPGDVVLHHGAEHTLSSNDIIDGGFHGRTIFGDSYMSGTQPAIVLLYSVPKLVRGYAR